MSGRQTDRPRHQTELSQQMCHSSSSGDMRVRLRAHVAHSFHESGQDCHSRGFTLATTARLSGECAAWCLLCSPAPELPPYSITSTCPRGTLHLSRYLWLITAWLSCEVLEETEAAASRMTVGPSSDASRPSHVPEQQGSRQGTQDPPANSSVWLRLRPPTRWANKILSTISLRT